MNRDNNAFEKAFDILLKEASIKAENNLVEKLQKPTEEVVFSKEHEQKMQNMFRRERRKQRNKKLIQYSRRCACIIAVIIVVGAVVSIGSVEALRIRFINFIIDNNAPNTDVNFREDRGKSYADEKISMEYIPEGFVLTERSNVASLFLNFENGDKYFGLTVDGFDSNHNVDTEDMKVEYLRIRGNEAIYLSKPAVNILLWSDNKNFYIMDGNISKEEMVKIAEQTY